MKLSDVNIFTGKQGFQRGQLSFEDHIMEIELQGPEDPDLAYVLPGLIDVHTHGNSGGDFSDGTFEGISQMADGYARHGITGFAGTTVTLPFDVLKNACKEGARFRKERVHGAQLYGIHLEGPYLSYNKRGAQNPNYLQTPDIKGLYELMEASEGLVRLISIAPELDGSMEFIREASRKVRVSLAHTEADYETASLAFEAGASQLTHTFNAMSPIMGRKPGPIIAGYDCSHVFAELISDGKHVAPANVRFIFRLFGADRVVLISDSLRCADMPEGNYILGGQEIHVKDGLAYLSDGTISGSCSNLFEGMKKAISFGIPREDAILAATRNPAISLGIEKVAGSIETGKNADLVVCDKDFNIQSVFVLGVKQ